MGDLLNRLVARSIGMALPVTPRLRLAYESPRGPAPSAPVHEDREREALHAGRVSAASVVRQSSIAEPYRGPLHVQVAEVQSRAPAPRMQFNLPGPTAPRAGFGPVDGLTATAPASISPVQRPQAAIQRAPAAAAPATPATAQMQLVTPSIAEHGSGSSEANRGAEPIAGNLSEAIDQRGAPVTPRTEELTGA